MTVELLMTEVAVNSDFENSSGSDTDEVNKMCVLITPKKKHINEWKIILSKTEFYTRLYVENLRDRKPINQSVKSVALL